MTTRKQNTIFSWFHSLFGRSGSSRLNGVQKRKRSTYSHPATEQLEIKQCPAATLTASLATNGLLQIEGTNGAERIIVREQAGRMSIDNVTISGGGTSSQSISSASVMGISIAALGGDDIIILSVPNQLVSKSARIDGGVGNDQVFGGSGNDVIYGSDGNDLLAGMAGNDMVFGGLGADRLYGGTGADRFLFQAGDGTADADASDAVITFRDGNRRWSDAEIIAVDSGLGWLHARTGNTRMLKLSSGGNLSFERNSSLPSGPGALADNDSAGHLRFADILFTTHRSLITSTVAHELAHNWDDASENPYIASFRSQSGWTQGPYNSQLAVSTDRLWQYNRNATFARDYGRTNPLEDFATTIEVLVGQPAGQNISGKLAVMNRFLDALRSGSFASTARAFIPPSVGHAITPNNVYNRVINDVATISNTTTGVMNYYLAWPGQSWQSFQLQSGRSNIHSSADPNQRNLAPIISFDNSFQAGYQESSSLLPTKFYVVSPTEGWGAPSRTTDGFVYSFVVNSSRTGVALQSDMRMDTTKHAAERQAVTGFPNLGTNFEMLGAATGGGYFGVYNCLAWTLGNVSSWEWQPAMNSGGIGSIQTMDRLYAAKGFVRSSVMNTSLQPGIQKVVVYWGIMEIGGVRVVGVTHGALQQADGTWTSKLGPQPLIRHQTPEALNGDQIAQYGRPIAVYYRPTTYGWTNANVAPGAAASQQDSPAMSRTARTNSAAGTLTAPSYTQSSVRGRVIVAPETRLAMSIGHDRQTRTSLRNTASVKAVSGKLSTTAVEKTIASKAQSVEVAPTDVQLIDALMAGGLDLILSA